MKKIYGNTDSLKANYKRRLENLYRRRESSGFVVSPELCHEISKLSFEIRKQIGLLINRAGKVAFVIVGDANQIFIPDLENYKAVQGRLAGLKCIHTHLKNEVLSRDDLTDLVLLRLDLMASVTINEDGTPHQIHTGFVRPSETGDPYTLLPPLYPGNLNAGCDELIRETDEKLAQNEALYKMDGKEERAILVSVTTDSKEEAVESLDELKELARSSNISVIETILQRRKKTDPRFLIGKGKLNDIIILAMQKGATLIVFDQELNPSQIRAITDHAVIKVIDRTQMILDIFARRAQTKEGRLQVELAQLKYLLPRLITHNTAMSRLTGGIGGRGPGETKLEVNRRRVRDRITNLQKAVDRVKKQRGQQKSKRKKRGVPTVSIVGYTNAGKSTLLNTLTQSNVIAEDQLFATLDPASRRLRFPRDVEVIITDTVGFIRNLPKELMVSFRATLEELENADVLLHVVDVSNPRYQAQIESVEKILSELNLNAIPTINVLNKMDIVDAETVAIAGKRFQGIPVSATQKPTLVPLLDKIEEMISIYSPGIPIEDSDI